MTHRGFPCNLSVCSAVTYTFKLPRGHGEGAGLGGLDASRCRLCKTPSADAVCTSAHLLINAAAVYRRRREEGGLGGSVVVQDGLQLANQLLRRNAANQRLFREMGHTAQLAALLQAAAVAIKAGGGGSGEAAASEMAPALMLALESVLLLVSAGRRFRGFNVMIMVP